MRTQPSLSTRWLLVFVLCLGVVAMHSVVGPGACSDEGHGGEPAMAHTGDGQFGGTHHAGRSGPEGPPESSVMGPRGTITALMPHDGGDAGGCCALGHFCLAILNALGLVLLLGLIIVAAIMRRPDAAAGSNSSVRSARSPPADRPPSRTSLTELCVSRR